MLAPLQRPTFCRGEVDGCAVNLLQFIRFTDAVMRNLGFFDPINKSTRT